MLWEDNMGKKEKDLEKRVQEIMDFAKKKRVVITAGQEIRGNRIVIVPVFFDEDEE